MKEENAPPLGRDVVRPGTLVVKDKIYSVTELTSVIKIALETAFPQVWVEGEVSNSRKYGSGHIYLTLKDAGSSIPAVIWRGDAARLKFEIKDGQQFVCRGKIDVYPPRGAYQLIIDRVEPKGKGALQLAFEQLKEKLKAEGLFDPARKRKLPLRPKRIGIVTSPTGAAIVDILRTLDRRSAKLHVLIYPARVQGDGAADDIVAGIETLGAMPGLDVLIVGRGGGSIEDLWSFNEERVARAIAASPIPVISAVGHEVDFTIADFVADIRASTPTAAAELVVATEEAFADRIANLERRAGQSLRFSVQERRHELTALAQHRAFQGFRLLLRGLEQGVDDLEGRAWEAIRSRQRQIAEARSRAVLGEERMASVLRARLRDGSSRAALVEQRIASVFRARLAAWRGDWETLAAGLHAQSPLAVLKKGYTLVWGRESAAPEAARRPIISVADVKAGNQVAVSFFKGEFTAV
ncbi:MAG: exodeoxyribonuclease VII large subunit, partial [Candidatus Aminicenantes bacterium]|nr:exodeoxyribonuclease VII large subunit [Candidatus Aminicenantes bacterium]